MLTRQRNRLINLIQTYRVNFTHEYLMESLQGISVSFEEIVSETYRLLDDPVAENDHALCGILRLLAILRHVDDRQALLSALNRIAQHESVIVSNQVVALSSFVLRSDEQVLSEEQKQMLEELAGEN